MQTELIIVSEYCHKCHIEPSFIDLLEEGGLIEVRTEGGEHYLLASQLPDVERYSRMYYDLSIWKVSMPFIICWKGWKACEGKSVRSGTSLLSLREKALWRIGEKIVSCVEILRSRWFRPEPLYHINRAFIKGGQSVCSALIKALFFYACLCLFSQDSQFGTRSIVLSALFAQGGEADITGFHRFL